VATEEENLQRQADISIDISIDRSTDRSTDIIWLGTRQQLAKLNLDALSAELFPTISYSQVVRDLGVLLDSELTFSHRIDQVCRRCYYQLKQLRVIARSLTFNADVSFVRAFVFSRLDYRNSIFAGLPGVRMKKLRRVHRAAARLIGGFRKFDHILYCIALASIPTAHPLQDRVLGVAVPVLAGRPPI